MELRAKDNMLIKRRILSQCDILSKALQANDVNYAIVTDMVQSTVTVLESFRSDSFYDKLWTHCTQLTEKCGFKPPKLPRRGIIPARLDGETKAPYETTQQYYNILPTVAVSACSNCNPTQKKWFRIVGRYLLANRPADIKKLRETFDPSEEHKEEFLKFITSDD
uniref:Uncharacterized protein n=1 Tax=Timema genevievae TaxID=629358 RepID=A0A7R9K2Y2_TIMGE|nr:unnamed protein product [Timema genevievae]